MIKKLIQKRRAVSPILAAILLIGLAVTAGAIIIVFVLPMLEGAAAVEFVEAEADDRNMDGLLDKITVEVINEGTLADTLSEGTLTTTSFTGASVTWDTTGNVELPLGTPKTLIFTTTEVLEQIEETASVSITLTFDSSEAITLTQADVDMTGTATVLSNADMVMDFTDGYWFAETVNGGAATGSDVSYSTDVTRSTHTGAAGGQIDHNGAGGNQDDVIYFRTNTAPDDQWQDDQNTKALSPEEWDLASKPILSFWMKIDGGTAVAAGGTDPDLHLVLGVYDGETLEAESQNVMGDELEDYATDLQSADSGWVHVVIDLTDYSGSWPGTVVGSFGIRVIGNFNVNIAIDDVSVHDALV
jgi:hypothetical protein